MKCRDCPAEVVPGKSSCARCLALGAERMRVFRERQRQAGGCLHCTRPAVPGFTQCALHREYGAAMRDTEKYRGYQRRYMKARRARAA